MQRITPEELGRLYREHAPALRLYVRQWPAGDEDMVQETFIKLAQQDPAPEHLLAWLYCVARNAVLAAGRSQVRRQRRERQANAAEAWFDATDDRLDGTAASLRLAEVPLEQREVIIARIWGGLTFEEVAQLVGCSLPTAHRRYQAGLALLRERMAESWTPATEMI